MALWRRRQRRLHTHYVEPPPELLGTSPLIDVPDLDPEMLFDLPEGVFPPPTLAEALAEPTRTPQSRSRLPEPPPLLSIPEAGQAAPTPTVELTDVSEHIRQRVLLGESITEHAVDTPSDEPSQPQ